MFTYKKELSYSSDGSFLDLYFKILKEEEIGNFLISKRDYSFGNCIVVESFEIEDKYRNKGYSYIILEKINDILKSLIKKDTKFICLEVFPYKSGFLRSDDLIKLYEKSLGLKYTKDRIMVKTLNSNISEDCCYDLIIECDIL